MLRDGDAAAELAVWLTEQGAGKAMMWIMERLGGDAQRVREVEVETYNLTDVVAPVCVGVRLPKDIGLSRASGLPDTSFASDGQITKRPVRALTLSALAPRPGEMLWDLGAGSGSISVEWCLAGGRAVTCERLGSRVTNIQKNADDFGVAHLLEVREGASLDLLADLPTPDAVFVGGGGTAQLFAALFARLPKGTRLIANGVTLETEALLAQLHADKGGDLLRIELAQAAPLGTMRGWQPARPVVQWSVIL